MVGHRLDVARHEAQVHVRAPGQVGEEVRDAWENRDVRRPNRFLGSVRIRADHLVENSVRVLDATDPEHIRKDRRVGAPGKRHSVGADGPTRDGLNGMRYGAVDAAGDVHEGPVDIEEQEGHTASDVEGEGPNSPPTRGGPDAMSMKEQFKRTLRSYPRLKDVAPKRVLPGTVFTGGMAHT